MSPALRLGVAEREQQLAAVRVLVDERQRHLVEARGFLVGELGGRSVAGAAGVVDGLVGHAGRRRGEEVVGQLGEVGLEIGGVDRLERLGGMPGEAAASAPRSARRRACP